MELVLVLLTVILMSLLSIAHLVIIQKEDLSADCGIGRAIGMVVQILILPGLLLLIVQIMLL